LVVQLTREFRKTTAAKGTTTTLNKMFNEQNNGFFFLGTFLNRPLQTPTGMTKLWLLQASTVENSLNLHDNGC